MLKDKITRKIIAWKVIIINPKVTFVAQPGIANGVRNFTHNKTTNPITPARIIRNDASINRIVRTSIKTEIADRPCIAKEVKLMCDLPAYRVPLEVGIIRQVILECKMPAA